jgi:hypothetical protein
LQSSPFFSLHAVHPPRIREDAREIAGVAGQSQKANFSKKRRTLFLLLRVFPETISLAENQCSIGHFVSLGFR